MYSIEQKNEIILEVSNLLGGYLVLGDVCVTYLYTEKNNRFFIVFDYSVSREKSENNSTMLVMDLDYENKNANFYFARRSKKDNIRIIPINKKKYKNIALSSLKEIFINEVGEY